MKPPIVIELLAGPGTGKTTSALSLAGKLKIENYNVEYLSEYAKTLTWRGDHHTLNFQPYVTARQFRHLYDLCRSDNELEVIITDTSFLLNLVYPGFGSNKHFEAWVKSMYKEFNIHSIFLERNLDKHPFNPKGRNQTKEEAIAKDVEILGVLKEHNIDYQTVKFNKEEGIEKLYQIVKEKIRSND